MVNLGAIVLLSFSPLLSARPAPKANKVRICARKVLPHLMPLSMATMARPPALSSESRVPSSSAPKNPVSLRLYKVLSTRFDDESTREALQTLSELYTTPSKGKEIAREEEPEADREDEVPRPTQAKDASLKELIPGESAARARKHLRKDMESKLAEGSRAFLQAFAEVDQVRTYVVSPSPDVHARVTEVGRSAGARRGDARRVRRGGGAAQADGRREPDAAGAREQLAR